jgi:uncharacterized membrane protein YedE/YeeE
MKGFISLFSGFIFALGLGISGMTQPHIVRGFLDVFGNWDWRLMGVMIGAIGVHAIANKLILKRSAPILGERFVLSDKTLIDARLIVGAMLFGLGWGWVGICPGPGIVALASGNNAFIAFVISMLVGMKAFHFIERKYL